MSSIHGNSGESPAAHPIEGIAAYNVQNPQEATRVAALAQVALEAVASGVAANVLDGESKDNRAVIKSQVHAAAELQQQAIEAHFEDLREEREHGAAKLASSEDDSVRKEEQVDYKEVDKAIAENRKVYRNDSSD